MDKKVKKIGALILGGLIIAAGGVATGFALDKPQTVFVQGETIYEDVIVEKLVDVEKIVEVEVDNSNLGTVVDWVQDEYDEDLDVDYIVFEVEAKMLAETWLEENVVSLIKDEDFFDDGEVLDGYRKSEVSVKKIYDPDVADRDFEDLDLELVYEVKIRAQEDDEDREYFNFEVTMPFKEGEFEEEDVDISLLEE